MEGESGRGVRTQPRRNSDCEIHMTEERRTKRRGPRTILECRVSSLSVRAMSSMTNTLMYLLDFFLWASMRTSSLSTYPVHEVLGRRWLYKLLHTRVRDERPNTRNDSFEVDNVRAALRSLRSLPDVPADGKGS